MRLYSSDVVRFAEQKAIGAGYSNVQMIQKAGLEVSRTIRSQIMHCTRSAVLVLCGKGNNGKDGQVVAQTLKTWGFDVAIVQISDTDSLSDKDRQQLQTYLEDSKVIVDALLGMGQKTDPRGAVKEILQIVELYKKSYPDRNRVSIALDVPTGVNSDTGEILNLAFQSDYTICVQCIKPGLVQFPARGICGRIYVVDIGLNPYFEELPVPLSTLNLYTTNHARCAVHSLINRPSNCHKGTFGKVFIFEGVAATSGASNLSASAAIRIGSPLIHKVISESTCDLNIPAEFMRCLITIDDKNNFDSIFEKLLPKDCIVIGPGFGLTMQRKEFFWDFIKQVSKLDSAKMPYLVLDADALTILSVATNNQIAILDSLDKNKIVLTPHPKEASVLMNCSVDQIEKDRYSSIISIKNKFQVGAVLLKGASTIVITGAKNNIFVHVNGKPSLATGGSGDVLAGIIAGLTTQIPFDDAVNVAAYIHAQTSVILKSPVIRASDIIDSIPSVLEEL